ncbi:hypothetical protein AAC387_Pa04g2635 [Persea americana]
MGETESTVRFVHAIQESGRVLPSSSRWNSIEIDFGLHPKSHPYDSIPSAYSKSVEFNLVITDKKKFKRFIFVSVILVFMILTAVLLSKFLAPKHTDNRHSKNFARVVNQALMFFDAQKSGPLPMNNTVKFRGDSGMKDGEWGDTHVNLLGGFYDSGNNIKFGLPTAYTVTLLSWSVIEYHKKYEAMGELDHIKDIIKWGSDYLLKTFVPSSNSSHPTTIYSQVGSTSNATRAITDITCWQRPEDMTYARPVSTCTNFASDLAGETAAALASASLVFKEEKTYSVELIRVAEEVYAFANDTKNQGMYTSTNDCGAQARNYYNSSGYLDELVWGGTWLFFATGNISYLEDARDTFKAAVEKQEAMDKGVFYWNNKLPASGVLLTRLLYLHDPGNPYEETLQHSSNMTDLLMCSYLSLDQNFKMTPGGLILLRPLSAAPLQFAATAAFLSKLYNDYLDILQNHGKTCGAESFSLQMLQDFSSSQVEYILGNNPMKMSYVVGFGDHFPRQVHHRSASIPTDEHYSCAQGVRWLQSQDPNPNVLTGAMVAGPSNDDKFTDKRDLPQYTEPTISGNAGLVAALVALHDYPPNPSSSNDINGGIDPRGIFANIHLVPSGDSAP